MPESIASLETQNLHEQLLETIGSAVTASNLDGTVIYWNQAAEDLYGWKADDVLGRSAAEVGCGCAVRRPSDDVLDTLREGKKRQQERLLRRRDGSVFHASVTESAIRDSDGEMVGIVGVTYDISEQVQAGELAASTARTNQMLMDRSLDVICTFDREGRFVHVGAACERVWGYTAKELLGRELLDIVEPADLEKTARAEREARRGASRARFENRMIRKDGTIVEMLWSYSWSAGDGLLFGVGRDVTEEKATRRALVSGLNSVKRSERRLAAFVRATSLIVWTLDESGRLIELSDAFSEMTGKTADELRGSGWEALIHPGDRDRVMRTWKQRVAEKKAIDLEYRVCLKDGTYRWVSARKVPVFDTDGRLLEWIGTCTDINDKKEAEERYRTIVDTAHEGVWLIDAHARTTFVNARMADMLGYSKDELLGRRFFDFVLQEDRTEASRRFNRRSEGTSETYELRFRHKGGSTLWLLISGSPFYDAADTFTGALGMVTDISMRKQHEKTLIEAKETAEDLARMKSALLTNLSHEIRTPVTAILGIAQIVAEDSPEPMQEYVELIESNVARLEETLDAVRDLTALENESFDLNPESFDVVAHVRELVRHFDKRANEKGLNLQLDRAESPLFATVDRHAFDGVVTRLLSNSVKFTHQGDVTVRIVREADELQVSVSDTGIGIGETFLSRLFNDFEQESDGLARDYEGSGLGLSITKRLVDRMGGRIAVRSEKGAGSTFTVRFPACPIAQNGARQKDADSRPAKAGDQP